MPATTGPTPKRLHHLADVDLLRSLSRPVLAHPYRVLSVVLALISSTHLLANNSWAGSWGNYIRAGVHILASPHWYHLYAVRPDIQMGPLTFVVAAPLVLILKGEAGRLAGVLLMLLLGIGVVRDAQRLLASDDPGRRWRWLLVSAVFLIAWPEVAVRYGHLDDALAVFLAVRGVRLLREGRSLAAAVAIGLSVDSKPWMLPLAAVLLAAPRYRWRAVAIAAVLVAVAWAPFFLLDPASIRALQFKIPVSPGSTLWLLGIHAHGTPPWCRPVQFLGGAVLAAFLAWRRRLLAALLAVVAFRLLLDPGTHPYYVSGLLAATLLLDIEARIAFATVTGILLLLAPSYLVPHGVPAVVGAVRTAGLLVLLVAALVVPLDPRPRAGAAPGPQRGAIPSSPVAS